MGAGGLAGKYMLWAGTFPDLAPKLSEPSWEKPVGSAQCSRVGDAHRGALIRKGAQGLVDACGSAPWGPKGLRPGGAITHENKADFQLPASRGPL